MIDLSDVLKRPSDINDLKRNSYGEFRTTVPSDEILQSERSSTVLAGPGELAINRTFNLQGQIAKS